MSALDPRWRPLIERALRDRLQPRGPADPAAVDDTLAFLRESRDAMDPTG